MNYHNIHQQIITRAQQREAPLEHLEVHHIIPRSLGGKDVRTNLVSLTLREHFLIHKILIRLTNGIARRKMVNAFCFMAFTKNNRNLQRPVSARDYEYARKICKEGMYTKERNEKISMARRVQIASGWKQERTEDTKAKHRATLALKKENGIGMGARQKAAISTGLKGNKNGLGHSVNDEHRRKVAETQARTFKIAPPNSTPFTVTNLSEWLRSRGIRTRIIGRRYCRGALAGYLITAL